MSSLIVLVVLLIIVIGIVALLAKLNPLGRIKVPRRTVKIIIAAYLGICILSLPVLYILPTDNFNKSSTAEKSGNSGRQNNEYFYDCLNNGKLTELENKYKSVRYLFPKKSDVLSFDIPIAGDNYPIWIEKKASDDGMIEVNTFKTPYTAANIDITDQVPSIKVSMTDDYLKIGDYKSIDIGIYNFDYVPYPLGQFKKDNAVKTNIPPMEFGVQALYIRIPAGMSVDKGKYNVMIIGENQ
jgi:hypothetical protein